MFIIDKINYLIDLKTTMKKIILLTLLLAGLLTALLPVNNLAAEFIKADDTGNVSLTDVTKRFENVYAGGNNIVIKAPIFKDLYIGGSNINIESTIERSLFAGASNVTIKNTTIGGGAKIGGSNITLENVTIEDDLFIGSTNVTISNSTIKGDLIVGTANITMTGSTVAKNMYYGGPKNDTLKSQVKGEYKEDTSNNNNNNNNSLNINKKESDKAFFSYYNAATILSALVILLAELFVLKKYNKIRDKRIGFGTEGKSFQHLGTGALFLLLIPLLIIGAFVSFGLLAPLTLNLAGLITLSFILITPLTSYYIANLFIGDNVEFWHPMVIFAILSVISFIPIINGITTVIMFVLNIMTIGYYMSKTFSAYKRELEA